MEKKIQQVKLDAVKNIAEELNNSKDVFFTEYRGLTVAQMTELRRALRKENATFRVSKNSLVKVAFGQTKKGDVPADFFTGPVAIAYAKGESGPVAKALVNFAKENTAFVLKGGLVDGELYDNAKVTAYGNLPSRLEVIAMIAQTVNGVASKLARTMQAVVEQKANS